MSVELFFLRLCSEEVKLGHAEVAEGIQEERTRRLVIGSQRRKCNWNADTTSFAAESGNIKILKWALKMVVNGIPGVFLSQQKIDISIVLS